MNTGFYTITSPSCYLTGAVGGGFPPIGQHIEGEMGGFWFPPAKILESVGCSTGGEPVEEGRLKLFRYGYTWVTHVFSTHRSAVKRHISVKQNTLQVSYECLGEAVPLSLKAKLSTVSSWYSGLNFKLTSKRVGRSLALSWDAGDVKLSAKSSPLAGGLGRVEPGCFECVGFGKVGFRLTVQEDGVNRVVAQRGASRIEEPYAEATSSPKIYGEVFTRSLKNLSHLACSDGLGEYFSAGHPEFPWLFGIDTLFTVDHTKYVGFRRLRLASLMSLLDHRDPKVGLIPHEVVHGGKIFNPGDLEETAYFVEVYLGLLLESGKTDGLAQAYDTCRQLLHRLSTYDADGDLVAEGSGIVEKEGREKGAKIDVACYTALAYRRMALAAELLGLPEATEWRRAWRLVSDEINTKYWCEKSGTYRQLKLDGQYIDTGDWTCVLPYVTRIAPRESAHHLRRLAHEPYSGRHGLYLTRRGVGDGSVKAEPTSMPIGTGLLASALFWYGCYDEGWHTLDKLVSMYGASGPGYLPEIAPNLGCHTQAWSYSSYVCTLLDGSLRPMFDGPSNTLMVDPPAKLETKISFRGLTFGPSTLNVDVDGDRLTFTTLSGGIVLRHIGEKSGVALRSGESYTFAPP